MNKKDLIEHVALSSSISKAIAAKTVEATLEGISNGLKRGDSVMLVGFGTFKVSHRDEREGHNPRTSEKIIIEASNLPTFKAGKHLKEMVNK